jgi:hypothetical protein
MTLRYAVGIRIGNRADQMTVEAEDALIAALKVKMAHPKPLSPTCASETPAAIGAIRTPARSVGILPGTPEVIRLAQSDLIGDNRQSHACSSAEAPASGSSPPTSTSSSRQPVPARQRNGQGDRPCLSASTWAWHTKQMNLRATIMAGGRLGRRGQHARISARRRARPGRAPVSRWHPGACESEWR